MRVAVIGGGIQGVGIALELCLRGASVDLIEKSGACLQRASLRNEGKIHLGFTYAKDTTLATARLMIEGGLQFEPIVTRWLETRLPEGPMSSSFCYAVHRDSLVDSDTLAAYYRTVSKLIVEAGGQCGRSYFGFDASADIRRIALREQGCAVDSEKIAAIFQTPERAIDPEFLADRLRARICADRRINIHTESSVTRVDFDHDGVDVTATGPGGIRKERYDHAVNASWEGRLAIDATAGVPPVGEWSFRAKHFLRVRAIPRTLEPPSITIVLGGFGDVVNYGTGDLFLSWYPVGRTGISTELAPPPWPLPLPEPAASAVRNGILQGLRPIVPLLNDLPAELIDSSEVQGGVIYALGTTDVHDPGSRLHERNRVGPRSLGRYHTVDTGKYSLAPFFAKLTADRIMGDRF